jgi:signal transduction histidine kinase
MKSNTVSLQDEMIRVGQHLTDQFYQSENDLTFGPDMRGPNPLESESVFLQLNNFLNDTVSRSNNAILVDLSIPLSESDKQKILNKQEVVKIRTINDFPFLVVYKPITLDGTPIGALAGARLMKAHYDFLAVVRNLLLIMSAIVVIGAGTAGWLLAKKALKPIDAITAAANQIQKGDDLNNRIADGGPKDEIGRLTMTINGMLERIEISYNELQGLLKTQRRFVSDASHELRTPLTTIRGNVDLLKKMMSQDLINADQRSIAVESIEDIATEAERMSRLVGDLLSLARVDAGLKMEKEPVRLKGIIESAYKRAAFLPRTSDWRPGSLESIDAVYVNGHSDYLLQMIMIFVENAFKYTKEGFVALRVLKEVGRVGLVVEDSGIGLSEEDAGHIFERFYRADVSRGQTSGTGLGLSIAKWILEEHEGTVEVQSQVGEGTRFTIWLPARHTV